MCPDIPPKRKSDFDEYFALHEKGAFREAYAVLREILQTHPGWSNVGDLYVWCGEFEMLVNDDVRKPREFLDKARELGCRHKAPYYRELGFLLWRTGEREEGIRTLEKCVVLDPSVTNLTTLGKVLSTEADDRSAGIWERVLEKDPVNCLAHVYMGLDAARSGNRGKALLLVKRAERLGSTARDIHEVARAYFELEEFQSAIRAYLEAHRLGYELKAPLHAAIAACYFSLGDLKTGRKHLEWAMKHDPEHEYVKDVYDKSRTLIDGGRGESTS